jgi:ABC-2 type transport system ATP-binding protein
VRVVADGLDKRYGSKHAVSGVGFTLEPGQVTGFLGPNGAGKSTTMRLMLGLDAGGGRTLYDDRRLPEHRPVTAVVGAHLDAKLFHPGRSARNHLRMLAAEARLPNSRVDEVIEMVGLQEVARKRAGSFSLGMGQRLGLAGALLADPQVLLLDEPANGLDPQSIVWLRDFLRHYAQRDRVVLVSSHLLSEMQLMADHVLVIARGRLIADESVAEFIDRSTRNDVLVRSADPSALATALADAGFTVRRDGEDGVAVDGALSDRIGEVAFGAGIAIRELTQRRASLEEAFLELTEGEQEYRTGAA